MPKFLCVIKGADTGKRFQLTPEVNTLLGRSRHADSRLNDPHTSRVHCEVELLKSGRVLLMDLDSNSGTFVNGQRVTEQLLKPGDVVRLGETELRLEDVGGGPSTAAPKIQPKGAPAAAPPPLPRAVPVEAVPAAEAPTAPVRLTAERLHELTGRRLSHYTVGGVIARGSTSVVFKAHDFKSDRAVALKVLFPEFSQDEDEIRRFVRAMKTMLPLRHPNLVTLYGAGKSGQFCWIAMEFVEGESLAKVIERLGTANMLDWKKTLRLTYYLARALEYAHSQNVIHRNLTPTNVLVSKNSAETKLGDLMLAKAIEGNLAQQITKPGVMLGDVRYMAPERASGGAAAADGRSDLYSLGALTYALLTGRPPFQGDNLLDTLMKITKEQPVRPKKYQLAIPDLLEGIVLKLLAKKPDDRFPNATALLKQMDRLTTFHGVKL